MTRRITKGNILSNPNELQAYEKVIENLEKKISEKPYTPESDIAFVAEQRVKPNKQKYAEELNRQIQLKKQQKLLEKLEQFKPAISEDFCGYPNLPQTPRKLKRERELEQKKRIRDELTYQLLSKKFEENAVKSTRLESEKKSNSEDVVRMHEEKDKKIRKKEKEKEILVSAWGLAQKAKELQSVLDHSVKKKLFSKSVDTQSEEFSVSPIKTPVHYIDDNSYHRAVLEVKVQQSLPAVSPKSIIAHKDLVRNKALKLQKKLESKQKNSYQYKIKQIIEQAKKIRDFEGNHNYNHRSNF